MANTKMFQFIFTSLLLIKGVYCMVNLKPLSRIYFPWTYDSEHQPLMKIGGPKAAEQMSYDEKSRLLYVIGGSGLLHVVDVNNTAEARILHYENISMETIDLSYCGNHVAVVARGPYADVRSKVLIYSTYDRASGQMTKVNDITVGYQSASFIRFLKNCRTLIVANEGEAGKGSNGTFYDPEGSVSIIRFADDDLTKEPISNNEVLFDKFNDRWQEYVNKGVRYIFRNSSFSQDVEPEFIAINEEETIAYVNLQENNAIAVLDINKNNITDIHSLGRKDWSQSFFDASDKDGGINMKGWQVYGLYQADNIYPFKINGEEYIVTANEGDKKEKSTDCDSA